MCAPHHLRAARGAPRRRVVLAHRRRPAPRAPALRISPRSPAVALSAAAIPAAYPIASKVAASPTKPALCGRHHAEGGHRRPFNVVRPPPVPAIVARRTRAVESSIGHIGNEAAGEPEMKRDIMNWSGRLRKSMRRRDVVSSAQWQKRLRSSGERIRTGCGR